MSAATLAHIALESGNVDQMTTVGRSMNARTHGRYMFVTLLGSDRGMEGCTVSCRSGESSC